jgi:2-phosphosulfolactate phosphatase
MSPRFRILRKSLLSGAHQVRGVAVVIDVFRAFTSAAFMSHLGVEQITLLSQAEEVLQLKEAEGYLAVGEVDGKMPPGFDLGNSPYRILQAGRDLFAGRRVAQRTTAGTRGAVAAAERTNQVILGSYVMAGAIARHLQRLSPPAQAVTLVAMGDNATQVTPDDERCADYIEHLLIGTPYDHISALQEIIQHECAQRFLRRDQAHFPPEDPLYCLQRDLCDFVLLAGLEDGRLVARRVRV